MDKQLATHCEIIRGETSKAMYVQEKNLPRFGSMNERSPFKRPLDILSTTDRRHHCWLRLPRNKALTRVAEASAYQMSMRPTRLSLWIIRTQSPPMRSEFCHGQPG